MTPKEQRIASLRESAAVSVKWNESLYTDSRELMAVRTPDRRFDGCPAQPFRGRRKFFQARLECSCALPNLPLHNFR